MASPFPTRRWRSAHADSDRRNGVACDQPRRTRLAPPERQPRRRKTRGTGGGGAAWLSQLACLPMLAYLGFAVLLSLAMWLGLAALIDALLAARP